MGAPNTKQDKIGETSFDLAKYAKSIKATDRLILSGSTESYIEIEVKTESLEPQARPTDQT